MSTANAGSGMALESPDKPDQLEKPQKPAALPSTTELTTALGIAPAKARSRRVWTPEEDEKLRLLVSYWGDQCGKNGHWDKISAHFDNRTNKDCRKRWFHSLDPKLKRGRWTEHEDKVLVEAHKKMGPVWHRIAQLIPGRTDDQCSKRYNDVLDPKISNRLRQWSPEEDQLLLDLVKKYGTRWRTIANEMDGRTGLTCRNRWRKIVSPVVRDKQPSREPSASSTAVNAVGQPVPSLSSPSMSLASSASPEEESTESTPSNASPQIKTNSSNSSMGVTSSNVVIPPPLDPPDSSTTTTHYTFTLDPQSKEHHSVTPKELEALIDLAKSSGREIVIHQHNYHHHHYHSQLARPHAHPSTPLHPAASAPPAPVSRAPHGSSAARQPPFFSGVSRAPATTVPPPRPSTAAATTTTTNPTAGSNGGFLGSYLMDITKDVLPDFDDDLGLDFGGFEGIPFNPS
ncbi:hypothetical protein TRVA0_023S01970 [Trichomonascus vanleenenianus]|uniref:Bas1p n=1 Tax=Trichomonascus vanleenenianus TaxID=2268995 RepID=UPI003ECAD60B